MIEDTPRRNTAMPLLLLIGVVALAYHPPHGWFDKSWLEEGLSTLEGLKEDLSGFEAAEPPEEPVAPEELEAAEEKLAATEAVVRARCFRSFGLAGPPCYALPLLPCCPCRLLTLEVELRTPLHRSNRR